MLKRYPVLVILLVTIIALAGSYQATSGGHPIETVEKRSSGNITPHLPRITLSLSQSNITIVRGSPAQIDIRVGVAPLGSFRVSLSAQQVPSGVIVSFSPTSSRFSFVSTMTVIASTASALGHFDLVIVALGGGATSVAALSVLEATLVHNLVVIRAAGPATATVGKVVIINATIANYGSVPESYRVNLYANNTLVATESSTLLVPFAERSTTISWNTTGFAAGAYSLVVAVPPVPSEADSVNNNFQAGNIWLVQSPTGSPAPPSPSPGNSPSVFSNWRELAIAVAIVWIIVIALVFFRATLRRAMRRVSR